MGTQIWFQINSIVKHRTKALTNKLDVAKREGEKSHLVWKSMKLVLKKSVKLVWKIHEVAKGKGPLS